MNQKRKGKTIFSKEKEKQSLVLSSRPGISQSEIILVP